MSNGPRVIHDVLAATEQTKAKARAPLEDQGITVLKIQPRIARIARKNKEFVPIRGRGAFSSTVAPRPAWASVLAVLALLLADFLADASTMMRSPTGYLLIDT